MAALLLSGTGGAPLGAQDTSVAPRHTVAPVALHAARAAAVLRDPRIRVAREALSAAAGQERQAAARSNPVLAYGREQTSRLGQANAQDIAQLEWPLDVSGQRQSRVTAARFRREAAAARLDDAVFALDVELVRSYVEAVSATMRVQLATAAAQTAAEAQRVSDARAQAGDVAGYAARRLRLEAGRYAARRAEAALQARAARERFTQLTGVSADAITAPVVATDDSTGTAVTDVLESMLRDMAVPLPVAGESADSLIARAVVERSDVIAAQRDADAARADARLAALERVPLPTLSAGYKGEAVQNGAVAVSLHGFVAGFAVPLPFFDRRGGAVAAADATARERDAGVDVLRKQVQRELLDALSALASTEAERALLQQFAGSESRLALRAVQAAYAEGEISMTEWLESVRAWQETAQTLLTLHTTLILRRADLARAAGIPIFPIVESNR